MVKRYLCEHYNNPDKCKDCAISPTIYDRIYWLLSEYDWNSPDQTKKEFIYKLKEMMNKS